MPDIEQSFGVGLEAMEQKNTSYLCQIAKKAFSVFYPAVRKSPSSSRSPSFDRYIASSKTTSPYSGSSAFAFNSQHPVVFLRSSSYLRLLPRFPFSSVFFLNNEIYKAVSTQDVTYPDCLVTFCCK
jgi:hypothetical protein